MKKWYLYWEMDGCQWVVEDINLFETKPDFNYNGMIEESYQECFLFIFKNLLGYYNDPTIKLHCSEGVFELTEHDIKLILCNSYPEELI